MNIIILGCNTVGITLAEELSKDNHSVTIIDPDATALTDLQERLDISTLQGQPSYPDVLRHAGCKHADAIVAVTTSDEVNMVACQVAYSLFDVPKKIARIRSPHYFIRNKLFGNNNLPIDIFINPEQLITQAIERIIENPNTEKIIDFCSEEINVAIVHVHQNSTTIGLSMNNLYQKRSNDFFVFAHCRNTVLIDSSTHTPIEAGDEIIFVTTSAALDSITYLFCPNDTPHQRIMITGGGHIGSCLAGHLSDEYHVKLIDNNLERCSQLSKDLPDVTVLHGDGADRNLLLNENIHQIDMFCAMTNDDEINILSSLQARYLKARQVLTLINHGNYIDILEKGLINNAISPQQITTNYILSHLRKDNLVNVHTIDHKDMMVLEISVSGDYKKSRVIGKMIQDISLPKGSTIGAIYRDKNVLITAPDIIIEADDRLILFTLNLAGMKEIVKTFGLKA